MYSFVSSVILKPSTTSLVAIGTRDLTTVCFLPQLRRLAALVQPPIKFVFNGVYLRVYKLITAIFLLELLKVAEGFNQGIKFSCSRAIALATFKFIF